MNPLQDNFVSCKLFYTPGGQPDYCLDVLHGRRDVVDYTLEKMNYRCVVICIKVLDRGVNLSQILVL